MFWVLVSIMLMLTWIGARPVENPYILVGQLLSVAYFSWFIVNYLIMATWINKI